MIVLRTNSHRARRKLRDALGRKPQYYYTWEHGGCFVALPVEVVNKILPITGVTRSRVKFAELALCW